MGRALRIANCSGFYGDRLSAMREQLEGGEVDVLTGDWLAELTMLILAKDRIEDQSAGYAKTFLPAIEPLLATIAERGVKVVSNAGGLNPQALAAALTAKIRLANLDLVVAVVEGDDISERVASGFGTEPFAHLDTGVALTVDAGAPVAANAYIGCWGIVEALDRGADIVITGRVTDAAVVIGPAAWFFGWARDAWDRLAGALAAGHVIECGTQATGGNYPFFEEISRWDGIGFPIAEISEDGSAVITRHPGTGGLVSRGTVLSQLLYEIGPPTYLSPDVIGHFDTLQVDDEGDDRVRISGARGSPPPPTLKAGVVLQRGFRNFVTFLLGGDRIEEKAAIVEAQLLKRLGGASRFEEVSRQLIAQPPSDRDPARSLSTLTFGFRHADPKRIDRALSSAAVELALASVPGLTLAELPGKPQACGWFWPTLIPREHVTVRVWVGDAAFEVSHPPCATPAPLASAPERPAAPARAGRLGDWVGARSGDKGGNANVGFWARDPADADAALSLLTEAFVREHSGYTGPIDRYELPNLGAVNFVLRGWLGLGVGASVRPDPQAKCLAEHFLAVRPS
jgi:hypothetical protein